MDLHGLGRGFSIDRDESQKSEYHNEPECSNPSRKRIF
jgi:hypothetical protein